MFASYPQESILQFGSSIGKRSCGQKISDAHTTSFQAAVVSFRPVEVFVGAELVAFSVAGDLGLEKRCLKLANRAFFVPAESLALVGRCLVQVSF